MSINQYPYTYIELADENSLGNLQLEDSPLFRYIVPNIVPSSDKAAPDALTFESAAVSPEGGGQSISAGGSVAPSSIELPSLPNVAIQSIALPALSLAGGQGTASNLAAPTAPSTLTVDILVDEDDGNLNPGDISLREAIKYIGAGGTINFSSNLKGGTIVLSLGNLKIDKNLTVKGLGANQLTVSGNNQSSVFSIDDGNLSNVLKVAIDGLKVVQGNTPGQGGGVFNNGEDVTLTYMTIAECKAPQSGGGGIYNKGTLSLSYSTLFGNTANHGGGIANPGTLQILNSTLSGNSSGLGSGISSKGKVEIFNSTLTGNVGRGYALDNNRGGTIEIANSIVAQNDNNRDVKGTFASKGYNLIGNKGSSSGWLASDKVGTSTAPIDPRLGPLADNGGSTLTHALLSDSPALNAGSNSLIPANTAYDQRGVGFARIVAGRVDMGSFELQSTRAAEAAPSLAAEQGQLTTNSAEVAAAATLSFSAATYATDDGPKSVEAVEMNGDGWLDIVVANRYANTVSVLLNNGDGTFATHVDYACGRGPLSLTSADFNGDGFTDVATANSQSNNVSVLLGNGAGLLTPSSTLSSSGAPHSVASGDFNGDGKVDLAAANATGDTVNIFMNDGTAGFTLSSTISVVDGPWDINVFDLDADSDLDLVTANSNSNNISILLNNGDGTFASPVSYAVGKFPYGVRAADINNDGALDLGVANTKSGNISILMGQKDPLTGLPNATYAPQVTYKAGGGPKDITLGDWNGDGNVDAAVANAVSKSVSVFVNDGTGKFTKALELASTGDGPNSMTSGDFNHDSKDDLSCANGFADSVTVFTNQTPLAAAMASLGTASSQQLTPFPSVTDDPTLAILGGTNDFTNSAHLTL